jgi:hypothetical protein
MCDDPGVEGGSNSCRPGGLHHVVVFHLFSRPGVRRFPPSSHAAIPRIPLLQGRSRTRTASLSFVRHCVVLCCAVRGKAIPAGSDETLVRAPGFCGPLAFLLGQSNSCRPGGHVVEQVFNLFVKFALADGNGAARTGCAMTLEWEVGQARADLEVCTTSWFSICS